MATFEVSSYADLKEVKNHLSDDIVLTKDIDASDSRNENPATGYPGIFWGFLPIGLTTGHFTGTFNGNGYTISGLYIDRTLANGSPTGYNIASLFGLVTLGASGFIKDLNVFNAYISGWSGVGVVGSTINNLGTVENVHCSGVVIGERLIAGGFSANISGGTFKDCSSSASVTLTDVVVGAKTAGGFCGSLGSSVDSCHASGDISVEMVDSGNSHSLGGFAGAGGNTSDTIQDCTASGDVIINITGATLIRAGGFIGDYTSVASSNTIIRCFAYGDVKSVSTSPAQVGGFAGYMGGNDNTSRCGSEGAVENYSSNASVVNNSAGGFVGYNTNSNIANCYSKSTVCQEGIGHTIAAIGGFCGWGGSTTIFTNCYSVGAVYHQGTVTNGGGFIGLDNASSCTFTSCYWDNETSGWGTSDGGVGKSTVLMKTESNFINWDFDAIWELPSFTRSPGSGQTIWFSKVDDYDIFAAGTNDSDSFSVRLPTTNSILWCGAVEALIAGTGGSEWKIGSNDLDCAITPTNWKIKEQTHYGSKRIQPLKVNTALLFVDFVGRKIREMVYNDMERKYLAPDLSELAEHITSGGITGFARQKDPETIIWATLSGKEYLVSMAYNREQNVVAWSKHPLGGTDVEVLSASVVPGANESIIWAAVKRTINSATKIYIEQFSSRTFTDKEDCFFVDSGITYEGGYAVDTVGNLDHLEGETVKVLADGVIFDEATVSGGQITLQLDGVTTLASKIHIGLKYQSILQPMKPVVNTQMGTSAASIVGAMEMGVSLVNSSNIKYGVSEDDLYDLDLDRAEWVNLCEIDGLFTGTVVAVMDGGFSLERPLIISTEEPLPMTVRAIIPRMEVTGR